MPETDDIRAVVLQWIKKAENDLKNAVHTLNPQHHGVGRTAASVNSRRPDA